MHTNVKPRFTSWLPTVKSVVKARDAITVMRDSLYSDIPLITDGQFDILEQLRLVFLAVDSAISNLSGLPHRR